MATVIAVIAALGAAFCYAVASVIQHSAARAAPQRALSPALLLGLAHNPRWLAGMALAGLSFGIQGLALAFGPLALVQPLAATDVLFALPKSSRPPFSASGWPPPRGSSPHNWRVARWR